MSALASGYTYYVNYLKWDYGKTTMHCLFGQHKAVSHHKPGSKTPERLQSKSHAVVLSPLGKTCRNDKSAKCFRLGRKYFVELQKLFESCPSRRFIYSSKTTSFTYTHSQGCVLCSILHPLPILHPRTWNTFKTSLCTTSCLGRYWIRLNRKYVPMGHF